MQPNPVRPDNPTLGIGLMIFTTMVFASAVGMWAFGDIVDAQIIIGGSIIVGAGLFTFWRERQLR